MAGGVKVGTGYIDIRLGDLKKFWGALKKEVETMGRETGTRLGDKISKFNVDKGAFRKLTDGLKDEAARGGNEYTQILRTKLKDAGKLGGDAFLREFSPLLRRVIEKSSIDGREELLKLFDLGQVSPRLARTLAQALSGALDELPNITANAGANIGSRLVEGITSGVSRGVSAFGQLGSAVDRIGQRVGLLGFQITNLGYLASVALSAPVAAAAGLAAAIGIKTAAAVEDATVAFTTLLGSLPKAQAFVRTLRDFANTSPIFDIENVLDFSKRLLNAGIDAKRIVPTMTALSSLAAAYGLDQEHLNRALTGFTQMLLLGKVNQEELNQVIEAGIPINSLLAQALGITTKELTKLLADKKLSPDQLFDAIVKIGSSGKFLTGLQQRAQTLTGIWQQFKETVSSNLADRLAPQLPKIKDFLNKLAAAIDVFLQNSGPFFDKLFDNLKNIGDWLTKAATAYDSLTPKQKDFVDQLVLILFSLGPAIILVGGFITAISGLVSAFGFLLTPGGLAAGILLTIGVGLYEAYKNSKDFRDMLGELGTALDTFGGKIADSWNGKLKPAFEGVAQAWNEKLKPALQDVYHSLKESLGPAADDLAKIFGDVLAASLTILSMVILGLVVPALEILADYIKDHQTQVKIIAAIVLAFALALLVMAVTIMAVVIVAFALLIVVIGSMVAIFFVLVFAIAEAVEWIITFVKWIIDSAPEVDDMISQIGAAFRRLPGMVAAVVVRIATTFGSLPGTLVEIGASIVRGLIRGAMGQIGAVVNAAVTIGRAFQSTLEGFFKTGSPSRLTMELGHQVVDGFVIGLASMPTDVAVQPFTAVGQGDYAINTPGPMTAIDLRSALEGLVVVLDGQAVGRIQGRRAGLYGRAEF